MSSATASREAVFFVEKVEFMDKVANVIAAEDDSVTAPLVKRLCEIVSVGLARTRARVFARYCVMYLMS